MGPLWTLFSAVPSSTACIWGSRQLLCCGHLKPDWDVKRSLQSLLVGQPKIGSCIWILLPPLVRAMVLKNLFDSVKWWSYFREWEWEFAIKCLPESLARGRYSTSLFCFLKLVRTWYRWIFQNAPINRAWMFTGITPQLPCLRVCNWFSIVHANGRKKWHKWITVDDVVRL
jgi:hypothetical protein